MPDWQAKSLVYEEEDMMRRCLFVSAVLGMWVIFWGSSLAAQSTPAANPSVSTTKVATDVQKNIMRPGDTIKIVDYKIVKVDNPHTVPGDQYPILIDRCALEVGTIVKVRSLTNKIVRLIVEYGPFTSRDLPREDTGYVFCRRGKRLTTTRIEYTTLKTSYETDERLKETWLWAGR